MSKNSSIGFGISHRPYKSLNYIFEQEVRSERDYPDGYIGMKDPLIGYQVYESKGTMDLTSIGFGYQFESMTIGLSVNQINETSLNFSAYIDTAYNTFDPFYDDNFDDFTQNTVKSTFDNEFYGVFSFEYPLNNQGLFLLSYQSGVDVFLVPEKISFGFKIQLYCRRTRKRA